MNVPRVQTLDSQIDQVDGHCRACEIAPELQVLCKHIVNGWHLVCPQFVSLTQAESIAKVD